MCIKVDEEVITNKVETVYVVREMRGRKIFSPFIDCRWYVGKTQKAPRPPKNIVDGCTGYGWFHTLRTQYAAEEYIRAMSKNGGPEGIYQVYIATIPKRTRVVYGHIHFRFIGGGSLAIASKALKIVKKVSKWEIYQPGFSWWKSFGSSICDTSTNTASGHPTYDVRRIMEEE